MPDVVPTFIVSSLRIRVTNWLLIQVGKPMSRCFVRNLTPPLNNVTLTEFLKRLEHKDRTNTLSYIQLWISWKPLHSITISSTMYHILSSQWYIFKSKYFHFHFYYLSYFHKSPLLVRVATYPLNKWRNWGKERWSNNLVPELGLTWI